MIMTAMALGSAQSQYLCTCSVPLGIKKFQFPTLNLLCSEKIASGCFFKVILFNGREFVKYNYIYLVQNHRTVCWDAYSLMPNDLYRGRTAPLTSRHCILCIYSTNIGTEYFKHCIYFPFLSLQNAACFIILIYLVPVLFTFYIQGVLKFKKIILAPNG